MRKIFMQGMYIVFIIIITVIGLKYVSDLVRPKEKTFRKTDFLENAENIDVLFFGTSHMVNSIFPMELWNDYGIASYNLGGHGHLMPSSYWLLMNALDYCKPELVVIDCQSIANNDKKVSMDYSHWTLDEFPLSMNKIKAVLDLFEDFSKRMEYLWDFSLYHSRWSVLTRHDYQKEHSYEFGAESRIAVAVPDEMININNYEMTELDTLSTQYLHKIIEECKKRDIEVLLTFLPFPVSKESNVNESLNSEFIAELYDINSVNFLRMDIVDYNTDCYDSGSHLNVSGGKKVTNWLGDYIQKTYNIQNRKEDPDYIKWEKSFSKYHMQNLERIKNEEVLENYLMLLQDKNLSVCIYVKENSNIYNQKQLIDLISNISQYKKVEKIDKALSSKNDYMLIIDNGWKDIWECVGNDKIEEMKALNLTFGEITYSMNGGDKVLYIQDFEKSYIVDQINDIVPDIQVIVVNSAEGTIEDIKRFVNVNNEFICLEENE